MKPSGLITLADLPELAGKSRSPRTTIVVARLDDRLKDPRYGKFSISQDDVDGWKRNLADSFGGRVSIDFDHSSDRGGGTKAAAWITGLHQDGKLVTADVQFTPKGAKAVRDGDYAYISPTFVANWVDEHGKGHGKALIGAALTNRPVLREGMPTLSLSADHFDDVATPRSRKKQMAKKKLSAKQRKIVKTLSTPGATPKQVKGLALLTPRQRAKVGKRLMAQLAKTSAATLAQTSSAPGGLPAGAGAGRLPPGIDADGQALHARVVARAARDGSHYFDALAAITSNPAYARLSDIPPTPISQSLAMDQELGQIDAAARALAVALGISWGDGLELVNHAQTGAALAADTGAADVPWLDTRELATPPQPWSEADFERDQRRAAAAGVAVDKEMWSAGAERGVDVVGQLADRQRGEALANHRAQGQGMLEQAQQREDERRRSAINSELLSSARQKASDLTRRAAASNGHSSRGWSG